MRSQIGAITEDVFGTFKAPTRFFEFTSETLNRNKRSITSSNIRARSSRGLQRSARRVVTGRDGTGRVNMDAGPDGLGLWLLHMLGAVATTQPDAMGAPTAYQHVFTLGSLQGKSLTIQKGVEREDETVIPYSFVGSKVTGWEFGIDVDGFLTLGVDIDARDVLTNQALVPATFADGNLFHFMQAALRLDGALVADVRGATVSGTNPMRTDRYYLGSAGIKAQQKTQGDPTVGGQFQADFVDEATLVEAYHTDAALSLELEFVGANIAAAQDERLRIAIDDIRLDGETPKVSGPEMPTLTIPFTGLDGPAAGSGLEITLVNTDAAA